MMNELFAVCTNPNCATVFSVNNIASGTGSAQISFTNSKTICPECGNLARINDGTYTFANEVITFLKGPAETLEVLQHIKAILEREKSNPTPAEPAEVLAKIEQASPAIANLFNSLLKKLGRVSPEFWLGFLLSIMGILVSHNDSNSSSVQLATIAKEQKIRDQVTQSILQQVIKTNKQAINPVVVTSNRNGRNKPCECGSKKKQRDCCKPYPAKDVAH